MYTFLKRLSKSSLLKSFIYSWPLAAVILLVVISSELLTVVTAAHQSSPAASVPVIDSAVSRSITVTLALTTGILWSAATPPVIVPATAPLAGGWSQGSPRHDDWRLGEGEVLG